MLAHRFHRAIQCRHGIVGQQKSNPRIVLGAALAIERAKTVHPRRRAPPGADANLERENLLRKLMMAVQIFQQCPKIGNRIGHSFGMIGVRCSARQRLFESFAGRAFPQREVLPKQIVKSPDQA